MKLKVIVLAASGAGMVLSCLAFLAYDIISLKASSRQRLETLAEVVANQSSVAVSVSDSKSSAEILGALSAESQVDAAVLYARDGTMIARYLRPGVPAEVAPVRPDASGFHSGDGFYSTTVEVSLDREKVGTVFLRVSLEAISRQIRQAGMVIGGVILLATVASLLLASRLEGFLTRPILSLVTTAKAVSEGKDYSIRASRFGDDELGLLTNDFNEMLGQIQTRDSELEKSRADLERRVQERTSELTQEVSERKRVQESLVEREEQYRGLVELSPDAILIHLDGMLVFANGRAATLLGAPGPEALVGRSLFELVHPDQRKSFRDQHQEPTRDHRDPSLQELKFIRLDGRELDVEAAASPVRHGGSIAVQVVVRDITKRKELDRLKNEFISTVSHELRTPLTSIRGSLGLVVGGAMGPVSPVMKPMIEMASNNCLRLVRLINDILDIEKIAAGKMEFRLKPLEIQKVVEQAIEANKSYADQYCIRFVLGERTDRALISVDQDRIIQVLSNLLSNAAKFSPKDAAVEVSVTRRTSDIRISVADRGPGIPEQFRTRVFQKFAQADSSDTRQKGGTGLGLSITQALVNRMGGAIAFESRPGGGTVFTVDFPEYAPAAPESPEAAAPGRRQVLVIEHDADVARLLRLMIEQLGVGVQIAGTASQARLLLAERRFDAMTLDIMMLPDESGISLLRAVRRETKTRGLPVVVVSAKARQPQQDLEGLAIPVVDWIEKPIDEKQFSEAIRSAVCWNTEGKRRILHVEDDPDIRRVVSLSLHELATVVPAATLAEARECLQGQPFDLALLDLVLPDGWGMELGPVLSRIRPGGVPIVVFSAIESREDLRGRVAAALVKSKVSPGELLDCIKSVLGLGREEARGLGMEVANAV